MHNQKKLLQGATRALAPTGSNTTQVPALIAAAGEDAAHHFLNFFIASIRNRSTRKSYARQARLFLAWCEQLGIRNVRDIRTEHVAAYVEALTRSALEPSSACAIGH